jgi:hypothetical protein
MVLEPLDLTHTLFFWDSVIQSSNSLGVLTVRLILGILISPPKVV